MINPMLKLKYLAALILTVTLLPIAAFAELSVYFLDVGQADATLLHSEDAAVLIDAGDYRRNDVVPHLNRLGIEELDVLAGTHPHADHIGQFPQVLENFQVAEVWMSGDEHTSNTFERALDAILASDADYREPRAGEVYEYGRLRLEILNPEKLDGDFHHNSLAVRAVWGQVSLIFTGDAECETEADMVERVKRNEINGLESDILQLGHHGSGTSTGPRFLRAVSPDAAVYSAGRDNQYGHPRDEVLERLERAGADVYGTDVHGTVRFVTDGRRWRIETEKGEGPLKEEAGRAGETDRTVTEEPDSPGEGTVDINSAGLDELQEIVHIGEARAKELIKLRPFSSLDELTRIYGIGPARLKDIKEQGSGYVE